MQSVWQLQWLSNIIWAGESECFFCICEWERSRSGVRTSEKKETERRKEGRRERASVQLWGVPSSTKLLQLPSSLFPPPPPPPPPPPGEREQQREREREGATERESERVTLTSQRRRDVKRRIYKGKKKKSFSLFCCLSSCILRAARSEEERGGSGWHIFYAASPRFLRLYSSGWSAGRAAAESSIGDIAPQQKSAVEEPGCLTTWPTQMRGTGERKARVSDGMCHAVSHTHTHTHTSRYA